MNFKNAIVLMCPALLVMCFSAVCFAAPAGYSEFLIPGDEALLMQVFDEIGSGNQTGANGYMHSYISVTVWADDTTIYYDHWEDGYDFDPENPATADETIIIANQGDTHVFESGYIETFDTAAYPGGYGRDSSDTCYDGRDRIYIAGSTATVTRASWTEETGTLLSLGWEVYPVRPQLTTYIVPFGEDLSLDGAGDPDLQDFQRVFAQVQATADDTVIQVDINKDGVYDNLDWNRDGVLDGSSWTLDKGEIFLLDRVSMGDQAIDYPDSIPDAAVDGGTDDNLLVTGAEIQASSTVQVQYIIGDETSDSGYYEIRGLSAFPRGVWDDEYYAPVDSGAWGADESDGNTDVFLYNPHDTPLTINYQTISGGSGSFVIGPESAASFRQKTGGFVPIDSSLHLQADDVFWGVSTVDTSWNSNGWRLGTKHDWAYSLVPAFLLENEHYLGWAPGSYPPGTGADADNSGAYITPAQDNTTIFIDFEGDGFDDTPVASGGDGDVSYTLSRLESQFVFDPYDGDMTGANIYATGPYTMAYGQSSETAPSAVPAIDVGYTAIPGGDFIERVLTVEKSTDPVVVSTASGATAQYTLEANTYDFAVNDISITDTLAPGWEFVDDSATITLADKTVYSGDDADPQISGSTLHWPNPSQSLILGNMDENQKITITFTGRTTRAFSTGDITRNTVEAVGTRSVQGAVQTFSASDFVFNTYSAAGMEVQKTTGGVDPLYPGDTYTYTIVVTNPPSASGDLTGISVYDSLPGGIAYVSGTAYVDAPGSLSQFQVLDEFAVSSFSNQDGTDNWETGWIEGDEYSGGPGAGRIQVNGGELVLTNSLPWWNNANDPSAAREVDLSGYSTAILSYDYRTSGVMESTDEAVVEISDDGGSSFTTIATYTGALSSHASHDISSYISADTVVRIRLSDYYGGNDEFLHIDNVEIKTTGDGPVNPPPNLIGAGDGYELSPGESLTLTFDVTVDDPLSSEISEIENNAKVTADQFPVGLEDGAVNIVVNPDVESARVGDRIWFDTDGDGVLEAGETGLANIEVTLKDRFGATAAVTQTDGLGYYGFSGIEPGEGYYIEVTGGLPDGLQQSTPVYVSPNRTDAFDLSAGEYYSDADIGYTPDPLAAALGDLIWSDADGDGFRDSGEPGLNGITVQLFLDDGDEIFELDEDTVIDSLSTDPNGFYLFSGVSASGSEDYFVYVDITQAALSDYALTTGFDPYRNFNLSPGDIILVNDFGFQNTAGTAHTISDRVWYDVNEDQADDGETGIAGVTIDLLDASLNVIATTETDSNGYYSFSGVPGDNSDYTINITDARNILNDYFGTTAEAVNGSTAIDNLSGDLDFTAEPGEPNFGYSLSGSIGDTVFNDIDGDGVQDIGEPGLGGVEVELYLDNGTTPGSLDAGDAPAGTLTTDSTGRYLFTGLDDGDYIVSIPGMPAGYEYTSEGAADNDPATGEQQTASISDSNDILDIDFGYSAETPRSVSGTVWNDNNSDGVIDSGETGFAGVTVELRRGSGLISSTTTDASGNYSFDGVPEASDYTVVITDNIGILGGYNTVYERTENLAEPFNSLENVDLTGGDVSDVNFGYDKPGVTSVVLVSFNAYIDNGGVLLEWRTVMESGTVGFFLKRLSGGEFVKLNDRILPALMHSPAGGVYQFKDQQASAHEKQTWLIEEVEASGKIRSYGPFEATPVNEGQFNEAGAVTSNFSRVPHPPSETDINRMEASNRFRSTVKTPRDWFDTGPGKIRISESGMYRLTAADISSITGIPSEIVDERIAGGSIQMRNQGVDVACIPDPETGLWFYGCAVDSIYSQQNVYYIQEGGGVLMASESIPGDPKGDIDGDGETNLMDAVTALHVLSGDFEGLREAYPTSGTDVNGNGRVDMAEVLYILQLTAGIIHPAGPSPVESALSFTESIRKGIDRYAITAFTRNPESDYWYWDFVSAGAPAKPFAVNIPAIDFASAETTLTTAFNAITDTPNALDHHAVISLNGHAIGEERWDGTGEHGISITFDTALLNEGENEIGVSGILENNALYDIFYVNDFQVEYRKYYTAAGDELLFNSENHAKLTVSGFTSPDILVFNVTDPFLPKAVAVKTIDYTGDSYRVTFIPASPDATYYAFTAGKLRAPVSMSPESLSQLKSTANESGYLIITPGFLRSAAETLAAYRSALNPMIVDIEDIYDEFNHGVSTPHAIKEFLEYAHSFWNRPPDYVVLIGDGSYDYKDRLGHGDDLISPLMISTPHGLAVSDVRLADVESGDHIPDFAIGRFPILIPDEMDYIIAKMEAFETAVMSGENWTKRILMAADNPDDSGDFPSDSDRVASFIVSPFAASTVYLENGLIETARQRLFEELNNGALLFNYIGHAGMDRLAQEGLLLSGDVQSLQNDLTPPVFNLFTCSVGNFAMPGVSGLSELLLYSKSGAAALWTPSGMSVNQQAVVLSENFIKTLMSGSAGTLGTALLETLRTSQNEGVSPYMLDIYNLLGDPALKIK